METLQGFSFSKNLGDAYVPIFSKTHSGVSHSLHFIKLKNNSKLKGRVS
ncbi:MAG: hypothetical protein AAB340_03400 [Patescibacteria group bacterium]